MTFLHSLISSPWAIRRDLMPIVAQVLGRLAAGEPMSHADRERVDEGRAAWAARRQESERYAGGASGGSIAVLPVHGILTQRGSLDDMSEPTTSMMRLTAAVRTAAADSAIAGIVLDVDSPGGSVNGVQELADAIYSAKQSKPVIAVANSLAASAAYWVACQAGELYAAPGAEVGSIGVYTMHTNVSEAMKQRGVAVEMISAGKYKTEANPYEALSDEARVHIQAMVDQHYDAFVRAVARGRNTTQTAVRAEMGQGRVYMPDQAQRAGMIDGTLTLDQAVARLARTGGRASAHSGSSALAQAQRDIAALKRQEVIERLAADPPPPPRRLTLNQAQRELEEMKRS